VLSKKSSKQNKKHINRVQMQSNPQNGRKYLQVIYVSDKRLLRIHKELLKVNNKKEKITVEKLAKNLKRYFPKKIFEWLKST
jgi:hypothetical protein